MCSPTSTIQKRKRAEMSKPCLKSSTTNIHGILKYMDSISTGAGGRREGSGVENVREGGRERKGRGGDGRRRGREGKVSKE